MFSKCFVRTSFYPILLREYSRQSLRSLKPNYRNPRTPRGRGPKETPVKLTTKSWGWRIGKQLVFSVGFGLIVYYKCTFDQAAYLEGINLLTYKPIISKVYELSQMISFRDKLLITFKESEETERNPVATDISIFVCLASLAGLVLARRGFKVINKLGSAPNSGFYSPFTCLCLHGSLFHLAANMYAFHIFKPDPKDLMNDFQLPAFLLAAGLTSSMVSVICKSLTKSMIPSIGASGAIYAMVFYQLFKHPDTRYVLFFDFDLILPLTSMDVATFNVCIELMMVTLTLWKKSPFDHACHFGGMLFGYLYYRYLEKIWWIEPVGNRRKEMKELIDIELSNDE